MLSQWRTRRALVLPALVFISVALLFGALALWWAGNIRARADAEIQRNTDRLLSELRFRMDRPRDGLSGAMAMFASHHAVDRAAFRAYVESRNLLDDFPGVRGFGFVRRVERTDLDALVAQERAAGSPHFAVRELMPSPHSDAFVVTLVEPMAGNANALGLDVGSEPVRRAALLRAVDSGEATMTAPIVLVQDQQQTPSVLVYLPVYGGWTKPQSVAERRASLMGVLSAQIVLRELLHGLHDVDSGRLEVELYDATDASAAPALMYQSELHDAEDAAVHRYTAERPLKLLGRELKLVTRSEAAFDRTVDHKSPGAIVLVGLLVAGLLARLLHNSMQRVQIIESTIAERTTELEREKRQLKSTQNELLAKQGELERIAKFDTLTGLPNRSLLLDRLVQAMAVAKRSGEWVAVVLIDLDGFKALNDRYGYGVGDQLLLAQAERMKGVLREGDTLARLSGDEFGVLLLGQTGADKCTVALERLLEVVAQPLQVQGMLMHTTASIGVVLVESQDDTSPEKLLRQADQAMYRSKQAGRNRYTFFNTEQERSVHEHHAFMRSIRAAVARNEFVLHYQPKVHLRTGAVIGVEALIRWQHPEQGFLAPGQFLPLIENDPVHIEVGQWVLAHALAQAGAWLAQGLRVPISVNIGALHLQQDDFVDQLRALLAQHPHLPPNMLEIELLETSALEDLGRVRHVLNACHDLGVKTALDDFGTGYSSLTYLKQLPVDYLKIDRSFVSDMLDNPDDLLILTSVVNLAADFQLQVVAEGVENVAQGVKLLALGCELGQGYGIARPMPAEALPVWMAQWRPDPAWTGHPAPP